MEKNVGEVQEAEFTEVVEAAADAVEQEVEIVTEVRVGMNANGELYFYLNGTDRNLVVADGLLDYAKREMNKVWDNKLVLK